MRSCCARHGSGLVAEPPASIDSTGNPHRSLALTKVERLEIIERQEWHRVSCAVRSDGTSPAAEFMGLLKSGMWEEDPDFTSAPDDEQVGDYYKLLHKMRFVAQHGEPERRSDINYLDGGVWEFKVAAKRIAFYDTDGHGVWVPKGRVQDRRDAEYPDSDWWWFPTLDEELRLLNAWPKVGQKADLSDIEEAEAIAGEDVSHDERCS